MSQNKFLYIMVAVSGSGKSTFIKNQLSDDSDIVVVETDSWIEEIARERGTTYDKTWSPAVMKQVEKRALANLDQSAVI